MDMCAICLSFSASFSMYNFTTPSVEEGSAIDPFDISNFPSCGDMLLLKPDAKPFLETSSSGSRAGGGGGERCSLEESCSSLRVSSSSGSQKARTYVSRDSRGSAKTSLRNSSRRAARRKRLTFPC